MKALDNSTRLLGDQLASASTQVADLTLRNGALEHSLSVTGDELEELRLRAVGESRYVLLPAHAGGSESREAWLVQRTFVKLRGEVPAACAGNAALAALPLPGASFDLSGDDARSGLGEGTLLLVCAADGAPTSGWALDLGIAAWRHLPPPARGDAPQLRGAVAVPLPSCNAVLLLGRGGGSGGALLVHAPNASSAAWAAPPAAGRAAGL